MKDYLSKTDLNSYLSNMELFYRPPGRDHMKITEYLDEVEERLRRIEDAIASNESDS